MELLEQTYQKVYCQLFLKSHILLRVINVFLFAGFISK